MRSCHTLGRCGLVRMLLSRRNIDADQSCKYGQTPICLAVANGHENIVDISITHGVDVDSSSNGRSAIQLAIVHGHLDVESLLIHRGASIPPDVA